MKLTFITIAFLALFVGINAASYQNGFIAGIMVQKFKNHVTPKPKSESINYHMMTFDTSLFDFPLQKSPVCMEIKIHERLTFWERLRVAILATIIIMTPIHIFLYGSKRDREFVIGYIIGSMIEKRRKR
jgi:hypothetical protein